MDVMASLPFSSSVHMEVSPQAQAYDPTIYFEKADGTVNFYTNKAVIASPTSLWLMALIAVRSVPGAPSNQVNSDRKLRIHL